MRNTTRGSIIFLTVLVGASTPAQSFEETVVKAYCAPWPKKTRQACLDSERRSGRLLDDLRGSSTSEQQQLILDTCQTEVPHSYAQQAVCVERTLDRIEATTYCESYIQQTGGGQVVKEACIEAELAAKARLDGNSVE